MTSNTDKSKNVANRKLVWLKVTITNALVFLILVGGFFWLVRDYFHLGKNDFTNSAQVEEFINPINMSHRSLG
jgi:membrane fusion protein (multidrug efflux system)